MGFIHEQGHRALVFPHQLAQVTFALFALRGNAYLFFGGQIVVKRSDEGGQLDAVLLDGTDETNVLRRCEYAGKRKQTRHESFLIEMDQVVPWKGLIALIEPHYPKGDGGRPAYPLMAMLRVHLMQNWFGYSDPAMEEALYETTILRQFSGLHLDRIPDETTILNFRRLLEKHELAGGILQVINGYLGDRGLMLRQGTVVVSLRPHLE